MCSNTIHTINQKVIIKYFWCSEKSTYFFIVFGSDYCIISYNLVYYMSFEPHYSSMQAWRVRGVNSGGLEAFPFDTSVPQI